MLCAAVVLLKVIVPLPGVKVLPVVLDQFPPTFKLPEGAVTEPVVIVKLATSAGLEKLHPPPLPLKVTLLNAFVPVRLPEIVLPVVVLLKVTVSEPFV